MSKQQEEHETENKGISKSTILTFSYVFIAAIVLVIVINQLQIGSAAAAITALAASQTGTGSLSGIGTTNNTNNSAQSAGIAGLKFSDIAPKGVPAIYGSELGISYDDVSVSNPTKANDAIKKMAVYDTGITLSGDNLQRYIAITTNISCEYCCGAEAITFANGNAACGCAHSGAMRGLAKYLLDKHASQYTNDQILEELGKWKTLYFPSNITAKANALKSAGIELNFINLGSNKYRGIENGATVSGASGSSQVGGC